MRDWSEEELSIGRVERAVLHYLYEDGERAANHIRYEIIRVDRFESPYADTAAVGSIFAVAVKELFTVARTYNKLTQSLTHISLIRIT
jgi:hypothetical protein